MKTAIINTNIVMPDGVIEGGTVVIENGVIVDFGKDISTDGMSCIDANGAYTGPGLIDIHVHACGPDFFFNKPIEAADAVLSHGVTDVLPTLYFDMTKEQLVEQAQTIREAMESGKAKNIIGIYMEGPYLNPKYGCNTEYNTWRGVVAKENYEKLVDSAYDIVKVWCIAPERENIEEFVDYVRSKNPSAVFSVAHSEAEPEQVERFIPMGLTLATHHMNATGRLEKYGGCRTACVDEAALYNDEIYTELICDKLGIHVSPYMLKFVKKFKGDDKIILISDAFVAMGTPPAGGLYDGADDLNFDNNGGIAGSKITLDGACKNMMKHTGATISQVFKYASTNPARLLSLDDRGEIKIGNKANLITVNESFEIQSVYLHGEKVR